MNLKSPEYVGGHDLIKGKSVLITAAAGAGIGFSAATKAAQEGARVIVLSDIHEGRLAPAQMQLQAVHVQAIHICAIINAQRTCIYR